VEVSFFEHDPLAGNRVIKKEVCPTCENSEKGKTSFYFVKEAGFELPIIKDKKEGQNGIK
jgi:hypothetical protein